MFNIHEAWNKQPEKWSTEYYTKNNFLFCHTPQQHHHHIHNMEMCVVGSFQQTVMVKFTQVPSNTVDTWKMCVISVVLLSGCTRHSTRTEKKLNKKQNKKITKI